MSVVFVHSIIREAWHEAVSDRRLGALVHYHPWIFRIRIVALLSTVMAGCAAPEAAGRVRSAEQVLEGLENRLLEAHSVTIQFKTSSPDIADSVSGFLILARTNRCSFKVAGTFLAKPFDCTVISDGTRVKMTSSLWPEAEAAPAAQDLNAKILRSWLRMGVLGGLLRSVRVYGPDGKPQTNDVPDGAAVSLVRGPESQIDGRPAIALECRSGEEKLFILWLDSMLEMPVKRIVTSSNGKKWEETYAQVLLNAPVDPESFHVK